MSDQPVERTGQEDAETRGSGDAANKFVLLLKSRKFWAALVGVGMVVTKHFDPTFPLADDQVTNLVYVVVAYILGTSLEDGLRSKAIS